MSFNIPPPTPQRPLPGGFINTPARPNLARGASVQQQQQLPSTAPSAPTLTSIERAADTINTMLSKDANYPEVERYVGQGTSGEYDLSSTPAWTPFQSLRSYNIPEQIFAQLNTSQMGYHMGLFAEINHAWAAIDNQLYLWDYTHPNPELIGYEEQPHIIMSVKLVRPRPKVFVDAISYLLVAATKADIVLLGVQCQQGPESVHSLTLFRTKLETSIRGLTVRCIEGSDKTGRIFFADGYDSEDVYELNYSQEDRWFTSKCSKTNHTKNAVTFPALPFYSRQERIFVTQLAIDDTRNLLYSLSSNGTIRVFHMKTPTTLECVITRPLSQIRTSCSHLVRSELLAQNFQLISISPITAPEASQLSLVAVTSTGCRLYLSTTSSGYFNDATVAPNSMQVRHIRFPPPDSQSITRSPTNQLQPYQTAGPAGVNSTLLSPTIMACRYAPGSFFCFVRQAAGASGLEHDMMFMSAPHSGQIVRQSMEQSQRFAESAQSVHMRGTTRDIGLVNQRFAAGSRPVGFGNELAVQFDRPACEYAILTTYGIETIRRRRLVDIFASVIKYGGGPDGLEGDIRKIFNQYGLAETAATALAVACGQGLDVGPDSRITKVSDPEVLETARKVFIDYGGKAQLSETATADDVNVDNVRASPRHDGIAMYISRLVRSIWLSPIVREKIQPTGPTFEPTQKVSKLQEIQRALVQLQEFLENNKTFIDGLAGPEALGRVSSRRDEVELQGENRALTSLLLMINNIIEGIAFVLVLFDERIEDIMALLSEQSRNEVKKLTYEGLFSIAKGKDLAKELVKAIVNRNIAKGSNVESVAEALRRKCGSFCSSDDVVIFKAQENLKKAADVGANADRGRILLNDSLRLFEQVAKSLTMENLTGAVNNYIQLEFYAGAIRLALRVAQEIDRGNKALSWIKDGRPANDVREATYAQRTGIYALIFQVIHAVDEAKSRQPVVPDGAISQIERRSQEAYMQINESDDEVFQNYLYDWYLSQGWPERLLEIDSRYVEDYLRRSSKNDVAHANLLWKYYAHKNDFISAAEVQFELAKSEFDLTLNDRIEYLSRAKANASTRASNFADGYVANKPSRQELLRSITDMLDVANIQDDILQRMRGDMRLTGERREPTLKRLDGGIMSLDDLYNQFADQAGYYDICIYIYHAADYRSLPDIRSTWTNLVDQIHHQCLEENTIPWEKIAIRVEEIGHRVNLNENVFPVQIILQMLLEYDVQFYHHPQGEGADQGQRRSMVERDSRIVTANLTWPLDIFIKVGAPFEQLVATLEALWYSHENPFHTARNRKLIVKWLIYAVERWYEASRRQGAAFGGAENAIGLADCLRVVLGANELIGAGATLEDRQWVERGREIRGLVEEAVR